MDSTITAALIGAGAAVLGGGVAGSTTYLVTKRTLAHSSSELTARLTSERDAAREEREQERLGDTYLTLLKYVFWLSDVNSINKGIVTRQYVALTNLRLERGAPKTKQDAGIERDAFMGSGATKQEKKRLNAGPTYKDNASTWALVKALASNAVLNAFEKLMDADRNLSRKQRDVVSVLLREPALVEPVVDASAATEAIDRAAETATQTLRDTERLLTATKQMLDAHEDFDDEVESLTNLARAELKQVQSAQRA